jgi:hypothetical protein
MPSVKMIRPVMLFAVALQSSLFLSRTFFGEDDFDLRTISLLSTRLVRFCYRSRILFSLSTYRCSASECTGPLCLEDDVGWAKEERTVGFQG